MLIVQNNDYSPKRRLNTIDYYRNKSLVQNQIIFKYKLIVSIQMLIIYYFVFTRLSNFNNYH